MKPINKAFTLIELLLAVVILVSITSAIVINYDSLVGNTRYYEAKDNLKTFLINLKHQAAFQQKDFELTFDDNYNMYSSFEDFYLLDAVTNDLKILETSATKIVFFLDGTVQESYIITSNLEGTTTNKFIINVIGTVSENNNEPIIINNDKREDIQRDEQSTLGGEDRQEP
jgi:prepilin-type N-terminal cleavage/methylation domain-containing protein